MANINLKSRIALKVDTSTNWATSELVLLKGEIAIESDTKKIKIGDGAKKFSELPYATQLPNHVADANPSVSDTGYEPGTFWVNSTTGTTYILQTNTPTPIWIQLAKLSDLTAGGYGNMHKNVYDTDDDGSVDKADKLKSGDSFLGINDEDTTGLWTASKIDTEIKKKADATSVYTKEEVNAELEKKADTTSLADYIPTTAKGANDGVATLDSSGKVPVAQLPSYVSDVIEAENKEAFAEQGEANKIYVALDSNKTYRWSGTQYVEISASLAIGTVAGTAFDGAAGKANTDAITELSQKLAGFDGNLGALAKKSTIATADIDDGAVTDEKIADNTITSNKIVSLDSAKLTQAEGDYLILNCGNATN